MVARRDRRRVLRVRHGRPALLPPSCSPPCPGSPDSLRAPVLVDLPSLCLAVWAAVAWARPAGRRRGARLPGGRVQGVGAGVRRAVFAWSPWLLLGLVPVAVRMLMRPGPDPFALAQYRSSWKSGYGEHARLSPTPIGAGIKYHQQKWLAGAVMLAPWGGALVALGHLDAQSSPPWPSATGR